MGVREEGADAGVNLVKGHTVSSKVWMRNQAFQFFVR